MLDQFFYTGLIREVPNTSPDFLFIFEKESL
jgi:hypothetical protein